MWRPASPDAGRARPSQPTLHLSPMDENPPSFDDLDAGAEPQGEGWDEPPRRPSPLARLRRRLRALLFGTTARTQITAASAVTVVLTLIGVSLFVPTVHQRFVTPPQTTEHVTAADGSTVGSGNDNVDVTKVFPRLYSAKLGIDVAIQPGDGKTPPVRPIAYQYPRTAPLGQAGNTYLYAHDRPGMFFGLHEARVGDVVTVAVTASEKLYFRITEIHASVSWNDFSWLQASKDERLTLQTCNLSGDYDPRFIVVAKPVGAAEGQAATGGT